MTFYIYTEQQAKKFTDSFKFAVSTLKATLDANPNNPKFSEGISLRQFLKISWSENIKLDEFIDSDIQEIIFSMVFDRVISKWKFFASTSYPVPARMSGDTKPYPWTYWQFDINDNQWKEFMDDDQYNEWLKSDLAKAHIQECLKFTTTCEFISEIDIRKITSQTPQERWSIHTPYGRAHHDATAFLFEYVMNQDILKLALECSRIKFEKEGRERERKYDGCHCHD